MLLKEFKSIYNYGNYPILCTMVQTTEHELGYTSAYHYATCEFPDGRKHISVTWSDKYVSVWERPNGGMLISFGYSDEDIVYYEVIDMRLATELNLLLNPATCVNDLLSRIMSKLEREVQYLDQQNTLAYTLHDDIILPTEIVQGRAIIRPIATVTYMPGILTTLLSFTHTAALKDCWLVQWNVNPVTLPKLPRACEGTLNFNVFCDFIKDFKSGK